MKQLLPFLMTSTISAFLIAKHPLSVTDQGSGVKYLRFLAMKTPSPLDPEEMRESAQRLRKEAAILESRLEERRSNFRKTENQEQRPKLSAVSYSSSLSDSSWTLTYRFCSTPDESTPQQQEVESYRSSYGGKLTVLFRADGYTDILNHEPIGSRSDIATISKAWGWDRESMNTNSNNDKDQKEDREYVLFSTNVQLPASDTKISNEEVRFYWQCQIETDSTGLIRRLVDGTITIKQDITGPAGGFWGIFNGRGILAQFRYVGNFAAQLYSPKER